MIRRTRATTTWLVLLGICRSWGMLQSGVSWTLPVLFITPSILDCLARPTTAGPAWQSEFKPLEPPRLDLTPEASNKYTKQPITKPTKHNHHRSRSFCDNRRRTFRLASQKALLQNDFRTIPGERPHSKEGRERTHAPTTATRKTNQAPKTDSLRGDVHRGAITNYRARLLSRSPGVRSTTFLSGCARVRRRNMDRERGTSPRAGHGIWQWETEKTRRTVFHHQQPV